MALEPVRRVITGHTDDGLATFVSDAPVQLHTVPRPAGAAISFMYAAPSLPINNQDPKDWAAEEAQGRNAAGQADLFDIPGISCRAVDIPPGGESPMHRTVTFDFVVVISGSIQLTLDSGEERVMKQGDVILQKGTNHAWKNPHPTEWTRIYAVLTNSVPVSIAGVGGAEDKILTKVGI
ncbi:hypothetical protein C8J57DRAFT_1309397 [Mycena rebaudengoi]|nr:hypothetical protein C8J57DRAFT_1309397 [Mycena rebaudengoi]